MPKKTKKSKITRKVAKQKVAKKMAKKAAASFDNIKVYSERHESFLTGAFLPRLGRY
jgi:hypothetical protein